MILNTNIILEQVKYKKILTENTNPLVLRDQKLALEKEQKEKKLQEQIALIFKTPKFYTEAVIPSNTEETISETPEEKKKRIEDEKKERMQNKLLAHQTTREIGKATGGAIGYGLGAEAIKSGVALAGKGISALGKYTGYWS
jgi:ABC-type polar amino acid transport system ATPase subunit